VKPAGVTRVRKQDVTYEFFRSERKTADIVIERDGDRVKINWQFTRRKARQKFRYKRSKRNRFTRSET
jgi:hypothetical protein